MIVYPIELFFNIFSFASVVAFILNFTKCMYTKDRKTWGLKSLFSVISISLLLYGALSPCHFLYLTLSLSLSFFLSLFLYRALSPCRLLNLYHYLTLSLSLSFFYRALSPCHFLYLYHSLALSLSLALFSSPSLFFSLFYYI